MCTESRDGQIGFGPVAHWATIVLNNYSCPALAFGGFTVVVYLYMRKTQLPTGQPLFQIWLPSNIFWLSRATGLPDLSIPESKSEDGALPSRGLRREPPPSGGRLYARPASVRPVYSAWSP